MKPLSNAADLWLEWLRLRVIRPQDYDLDVVEALAPLIGRSGGPAIAIADEFRARQVSARDLIRAITPLISSFAGMMRDLLRLYSRAGAQYATGENLRIQYEYEDGHVVDESLAAFREHVASTEKAIAMLPSIIFDRSHAWRCPCIQYRDVETEFSRRVATGAALVAWDNALPAPPETGRPDVDEIVAEWWSLVRACSSLIASIADDHEQMCAWLYGDPQDVPRSQVNLAQAATDYWPASQMIAAHGLAEATRQGQATSPDDLAALRDWVAGFWQESETEVAVGVLTDIFSMPMWGRRHELYAAWILTQLDMALDGRLIFDVVDGALRFPFSPTRLATLQTADGGHRTRDIELWSEFRTAASDLVGSGRTKAVQPDYQFRQEGTTDAAAVVLAVEAKQYLRSALRNPGQALRDYALNLPNAYVFLVSHGPLSPQVLTLTPGTARDRVAAFIHVRPTSPMDCQKFRTAVASHLPPPPTHAAPHSQSPASQSRVVTGASIPRADTDVMALLFTLRWNAAIRDLDLHAAREGTAERVSYSNPYEPWGRLHDDAFDGGPELLTLYPTGDRVLVTVHVFSGFASPHQAGAVVEIATRSTTTRLTPATTAGSVWTVGELMPDGAFLPGTDSVVET